MTPAQARRVQMLQAGQWREVLAEMPGWELVMLERLGDTVVEPPRKNRATEGPDAHV